MPTDTATVGSWVIILFQSAGNRPILDYVSSYSGIIISAWLCKHMAVHAPMTVYEYRYYQCVQSYDIRQCDVRSSVCFHAVQVPLF